MKNRVIKFRVWDGEKMYTFDNHAYDLIYNDICGWGIAPNTPNYKGPWLAGDSSDKHDESVMMQYTGLKDKHGKEIYESDCVRVWTKPNRDDYSYDGVIEWRIAEWVIKFIGEQKFPFNNGIGHWNLDCEVIGNIYENPELCQ